MSVYGLSDYTSKFRITGLGGSGLDTDSIVQQLMMIEKMPVDKVGQNRQVAEWKQEQYRSISTTLMGFRSGFFDVLNPSSNMTSQSIYKKFTVSALENGVTSTVVSASANSEASAGAHTIVVNKMATADVATGAAITKTLSGTALEDGNVAAMNGKKFNITLDGVTKEITIGNYADVQTLVDGLQSQISTAFGQTSDLQDKIKVTNTAGVLTFEPNVSTVSKIVLSDTDTDSGLSLLGFSSGDSNRLSITKSLSQIASSFSTSLTFGGGTTSVTSSADITDLALTGKSFSMTVDGETQSYTFTTDPADVDALASTINDWAETAFGVNKVNIAAVDTGTGKELSFTRGTSGDFVLNTGSGSDALAQMNIANGSKAVGQLSFSINSEAFSFEATTSLNTMMSTINSNTNAKATMTYDEVSDKFTITAKQLGAGDNIVISESTGNFFGGASKIGVGSPVTTQGQDAEVVVDGQSMVRSSNAFTINGVTYNLIRENPGVTQNVSLSADTDTVYNSIKNFVDKYNEVISTLNAKISEEYDRDYLPLTDDQREAMTEDEIKSWEEKAKTGLLRNDSIIEKILSDMRSTLSDSVSGVDSTLYTIGITTGSYEEDGKLYIDETKLKEAIQNDSDSVMNLFSKESSISYTNSSERSQRYAEEGLAFRLDDILKDSIRTTRDSNGSKGTLIEKAGITGDSSQYSNVLYDQIYDYNEEIAELVAKLSDKENAYYAKFTAMETLISEMQTQASWLSSQFSTSS